MSCQHDHRCLRSHFQVSFKVTFKKRLSFQLDKKCRKKKVFRRNKVNRFACSPNGSADRVLPNGCTDYFVKGGQHLSQCMPEIPAVCSSHQPLAVNGFNTPPTDNCSPALTNFPSTIDKHKWEEPLQSVGSAINNDAFNSTAIRVDRLRQAIADRKSDDNSLFKREFSSLNRKPDQPQDIGKAKENTVKNRYKDVFPYDFNCVLLDDETNARERIYVNASYIKGVSGEREYVAAQGPSASTAGDFWKMIWQLNIHKIAMLTNVSFFIFIFSFVC